MPAPAVDIASSAGRGEGMTDSPHLGPVHQPGSRHWSSTNPTPTNAQEPCRASDPPPRTACADRRRRQGPTAADAVALRAIPDSAAYLDAPTNRRRTTEEKINYKNRGLTAESAWGAVPGLLPV